MGREVGETQVPNPPDPDRPDSRVVVALDLQTVPAQFAIDGEGARVGLVHADRPVLARGHSQGVQMSRMLAPALLRQRVARSTSRFDDALSRVKAMVRVAANTSAWLVGEDEGLLLKFDETGAYPGVELRLAGTWRVRPPLLPQKVQVLDFQDDFSSGCT